MKTVNCGMIVRCYLMVLLALSAVILHGQNKTVINIGEGSGSGSATCDCDTTSWLAVTTADFNTDSDTTLSDVPGLSITLQPGTYQFSATLFVIGGFTSSPPCVGGVKPSLNGTATFSNLIADGYSFGSTIIAKTRVTAFGTPFGRTSSSGNLTIQVWGTIVVTNGGTLKIQYAQDALCAGVDESSEVLSGSYLKVTKIQ